MIYLRILTPHEIWRRIHENMWSTKKILVMAEYYEHFVYWCHKNDIDPFDKNVRYVHEIQDVYGYEPDGAILVAYNWLSFSVEIYWRSKGGEIIYGNLKQ